jgi:hypothetical protein
MPINNETVKVTNQEKQDIKDGGVDSLPLNPTAQGFSGQEIRKRLAKSVTANTGSVLSLVEEKLAIVADKFDEVDSSLTGKEPANANIQAHIVDLNDPHDTQANQVTTAGFGSGESNVQDDINTLAERITGIQVGDTDITYSSANDDIIDANTVASAIGQLDSALHTHINNKNDPHDTQASQVNTTSNESVQTVLNNKTDIGHTHTIIDVTDLQAALDSKISSDEKNAFNGVAGLSQGKIAIEQLPNAVFDSLFFANTLGAFMSGSPATVNLGTLMRLALIDATNNNRNIKGFYFVADTPVTIFTGLQQDTVNNIYYQFKLEPAEEGLGYEINPVTITLETGDWMILTSHTVQGALNSASNPDIVSLAVVNNTYELASDEVHGIVKLGYTSNGKNEKVDTTNDGLFVNLANYDLTTEVNEKIQVAKTIHYYPNTKNTSNSVIPKGSNVKFVSATGDVINIAQATGTDVANNPEIFMGVAANNIPANQEEPSSEDVVWFGEITGVNLSTFSTGDILYFNTANGGFVNQTNIPTTNKIIVAAVVKGGSDGVLLVRPKWVSRDIDEVDGLTDALAGKSAVGHTHTKSEITDFAHTHPISDVVNLQTSLDTVGQVTGQSTKLGFEALNTLTAGDRFSTAVGHQALRLNTTGSFNTAVGRRTLEVNTTGEQNTAQGANTLISNTTGNNNTAQGLGSLFSNTTGNNNTAQGHVSLFGNTTGSSNSSLGAGAGRYIANGSTANATGGNSVFIGAETKALADNQTNQIVIGHNATGIGSNTVTLGNDSIVTTALKGNVGIGTTSPQKILSLVTSSNDNGLQIRRNSATANHYSTIGFTVSTVEQPNNLAEIRGVRTNRAVSADTDLRFVTQSSGTLAERMTIRDDGNVGIATTTPTERLDVVGNIKASGSVTSATVSATTSVTTPSVVATSTVKIGAWTLSQNGTSGSLDFVVV